MGEEDISTFLLVISSLTALVILIILWICGSRTFDRIRKTEVRLEAISAQNHRLRARIEDQRLENRLLKAITYDGNIPLGKDIFCSIHSALQRDETMHSGFPSWHLNSTIGEITLPRFSSTLGLEDCSRTHEPRFLNKISAI